MTDKEGPTQIEKSMTVKELIEQLQKYDSDREVVMETLEYTSFEVSIQRVFEAKSNDRNLRVYLANYK